MSHTSIPYKLNLYKTHHHFLKSAFPGLLLPHLQQLLLLLLQLVQLLLPKLVLNQFSSIDHHLLLRQPCVSKILTEEEWISKTQRTLSGGMLTLKPKCDETYAYSKWQHIKLGTRNDVYM